MPVLIVVSFLSVYCAEALHTYLHAKDPARSLRRADGSPLAPGESADLAVTLALQAQSRDLLQAFYYEEQMHTATQLLLYALLTSGTPLVSRDDAVLERRPVTLWDGTRIKPEHSIFIRVANPANPSELLALVLAVDIKPYAPPEQQGRASTDTLGLHQWLYTLCEELHEQGVAFSQDFKYVLYTNNTFSMGPFYLAEKDRESFTQNLYIDSMAREGGGWPLKRLKALKNASETDHRIKAREPDPVFPMGPGGPFGGFGSLGGVSIPGIMSPESED